MCGLRGNTKSSDLRSFTFVRRKALTSEWAVRWGKGPVAGSLAAFSGGGGRDEWWSSSSCVVEASTTDDNLIRGTRLCHHRDINQRNAREQLLPWLVYGTTRFSSLGSHLGNVWYTWIVSLCRGLCWSSLSFWGEIYVCVWFDWKYSHIQCYYYYFFIM